MAHSLPEVQDITAHVDVDFGGPKAGTGGYGDIYKGELKAKVKGHTGAVAVKMTRYNFVNVPPKVLESFRKELDIWGQQDHPHVLSLLGFYTHGDVKCPVSPWCESGTILNYFRDARDGLKPELEAPITDCDFDELRLYCLELELLAQVADGLAYLHRNNIVHGDIKSSNILVHNGVACLTDFGLSVFLAEHSHSGTSSNLGGSMRWTAPEYLEARAQHRREGDMWAFGCVILEVRTLQLPYHDVHHEGVSLAIHKDQPYSRPKVIHPSLWNIAKGCWIRTPPTARQTSQEVLRALKQVLKTLRTVREAFGPLPGVQQSKFGYQADTTSPNSAPECLSLALDGKFSKDAHVSRWITSRSLVADSLTATQDLTSVVLIDFNHKVGSRGYGDLYKGVLGRNVNGYAGEVAVKVFRFAMTPVKAMEDIHRELDFWQQYRHPHVLPLIGVFIHDDIPGAVFPWCDRGTIIQYMKSARGGHEPELEAPVTDCDFDLLRLHCLESKLLTQAAEGLAYLHRHNLAHGNIKASNILMRGGIAQLGDFGLSVFLSEYSSNTSSHLGTARWFAPESLQVHAHRTQEADMWAFGCAMLEVRTLLVPYHQLPDGAVPHAISKDRPFDRPKNIHPSLWVMAEACWSRRPEARIASSTLADRIKTTLEFTTLLRMALETVPKVHSRGFGYPNSKSTTRFSRASVVSKKDNNKILDLTFAVATARDALRDFQGSSSDSAFERIRRLIATTTPQLAEKLTLELRTSASPKLRSPLHAHTDVIYSVAFLPDSRLLVSASADGTLRIWDTETGVTAIGPLNGHTNVVRRVAVHGSRIATCSHDGTFRVWDADSGKLILGPITAHDSKRLQCITFSEDGTHIATGGNDNRAVLWDAKTGVVLREMVGHTDIVSCVAFSEDGTRLVSGSGKGDKTVRIWDVASGECISEPLDGHTSWVSAVCFSRDDKRIFSASGDGTIRIWDAETRALVFNPLHMDGAFRSMTLSPDGKRLVSGSDTGKIAIWDVLTGAEIPSSFRNHRADVWGVAFSPDGRKIASASADKTIALWDATDDWKKRYEVDDQEDIASASADKTIALRDATDDWKKRYEVDDQEDDDWVYA